MFLSLALWGLCRASPELGSSALLVHQHVVSILLEWHIVKVPPCVCVCVCVCVRVCVCVCAANQLDHQWGKERTEKVLLEAEQSSKVELQPNMQRL